MMLQIYIRLLVVCVVALAAVAAGYLLGLSPWHYLLLAGGVLMVALALALRFFCGEFFQLWRSLHAGLLYFSDGEFSVSVPSLRNSALREMAQAFDRAALRLRTERGKYAEREFILDGIFQRVNAGLLLVGSDDVVLLCNPIARHLLNNGRRIRGQSLNTLGARATAFCSALGRAGKNAVAVCHLDDAQGEPQTWQVQRQVFQMQGLPYQLLHFEKITQALNRAEVESWKNLIRLLSHELNNSLAPIASLADSGMTILGKNPPTASNAALLTEVFTTIHSRAQQLHRFLSAYANFSRLPEPQMQPFFWPDIFNPLRGIYPFTVVALSSRQAFGDAAQLSQVFINIFKNAQESLSSPEKILLDVVASEEWDLIKILDAGSGMSEAALRQALLPFYSTKRQGTGLGLALCREILIAHGGHITLTNRPEGGLEVCCFLPRYSR